MNTTENEIYTFDKLDKFAQNHAIESSRLDVLNICFDDYASEILHKHEIYLRSVGFRDIEISYTGCYSQGDGASFVGLIKPSKAMKLLNIIAPKTCFYDISDDFINDIKIYRTDFQSSHKYTTSTNIVSYYDTIRQKRISENVKKITEELENKMDEFYYDYCDKIYNDLLNAYDWIISDDYIKDFLTRNNYYFDDNGEFIS